VDGRLTTTLKGERIVADFLEILNLYVDTHYAGAGQPAVARGVPSPASLV
jgi:hypothetical protein